jgi:thymidylate synthase ThyX
VGFDAKRLADSVSPDGDRLTTLEVTFPRFVLAEFNTHRVFSRNSASSRAIPVAKQLRRVLEEPFVPLEFGTNQPGMQAGPALVDEAQNVAEREWLRARDDAVARVLGLVTRPFKRATQSDIAELLKEVEERARQKEIPTDWLNVHKQVANRLLEPFMWHTVIVSATEWSNFWNLRDHEDAQPEIRRTAQLMRKVYEDSTPDEVAWDDWHLPLIDSEDRAQAVGKDPKYLVWISVGRCARVSYLTHSGQRDHSADIDLHDRLLASGHMSPLEHPARPLKSPSPQESVWSGNFRNWRSYRKDIVGEADYLDSQLQFDDAADEGSGKASSVAGRNGGDTVSPELVATPVS